MAKNSKVPGLGLHALLRVAAALLGVVAFIMMFLDQVEVFLADNSLGKAGMDALFGNADSALLKNGSVISFIGYILVAAGAVCSRGRCTPLRNTPRRWCGSVSPGASRDCDATPPRVQYRRRAVWPCAPRRGTVGRGCNIQQVKGQCRAFVSWRLREYGVLALKGEREHKSARNQVVGGL